MKKPVPDSYIRIFLLFILLLLPFFRATAQDDQCTFLLDEAENMFNAGIFEDIPDLLEQCLENYDSEDKIKANRLIILARYLNDDVDAAEETMLNLLREFPRYKPDINDPADYQFIFNNFLVKNRIDIGFFAGTSASWGWIQEPWSPFEAKFSYSPAMPGISGGFLLNIPLGDMFSINIQPEFSVTEFKLNYESPVNDVVQIIQSERQTSIFFPVNARISFLDGSIQPFVKAGIMAEYLIASDIRSQINRLDPASGEIIFESADTKRNHLEFRERFNYYPGAGAGLSYSFNKWYLFGELNYHFALLKTLKNGSNRFEQSNLWTEGWIDSDFNLMRLSFQVGIVKRIYQIKKIR